MAIKVFTLVSLVLSIIFLLVKTEDNTSKYFKNDNALITFYDSTMLSFNDQQITQYVKSSEANRYKSRDVLENATIILRNKDKKNNNIDVITADKIIIKDVLFEFDKNVHLNRNGDFTVSSEKMFYNKDKKVAYNDTYFSGSYNSSDFKGKNLFLKQNEKYIKADNVNFKIEISK